MKADSPSDLDHDTARQQSTSDLAERLKELECLYRVAAVFADRDESVSGALERVVRVLAAACRFPDRAVASLKLDETTVRSPQTHAIEAGPKIRAPIRVGGRWRGEATLAYLDAEHARGKAADRGTCELFIGEEQAMLDAVAQQIGVFIGGVEADQRRGEMQATLWHANRLATIGQLASGVAHELNDPLANVLGFAQLAQKADGVPESVSHDLKNIVDAALRGREIIRKLLLFARQTPASKQPTDLNAVIEEALFLLEAGCENPQLRFEMQLAARLPSLEADPLQLRQVITNLVINAMQAIRGSGTITVSTHAESSAVAVVVSDTGAGMAETVRDRMFDPFFTTKDVGHGTGLGLSIVQGIVAEHNGAIEVETEPSCGTTFRVRLPVSRATATPSDGRTS
ncbi:sensor histidine kinase [Adonisia turfae]